MKTQYSGYGDDTGNVAIYPGAKGKPVYYASNDGRVSSLGYDDRGNLLIADGQYEYYGYFDQTMFYYLPKKGSKLLSIDLPNTEFSSGWPSVDSINYDGKYWVVAAYGDSLYRYTINIKAQEVDELQLSGGTGYVGEISLYRQAPKAPATQVVGAGADENGNSFAGYWKYPAAGEPYYEITADLDGPFGVAIQLETMMCSPFVRTAFAALMGLGISACAAGNVPLSPNGAGPLRLTTSVARWAAPRIPIAGRHGLRRC